MKKTILGIALGFGLSITGLSSEAKAGPIQFGGDLVVSLPLLDLSDGSSLGFGGLLRGEYTLQSKTSLTGRAGYLHFLGKEITVAGQTVKTGSSGVIPVLVGLKHYLANTFYGTLEGGFFIGTADGSDTNFGIVPGIGYEMGSLDLKLQAFFMDVGNIDKVLALTGGVGFNFDM